MWLFYVAGPALSGTLVNSIGFEWMLFGIAILNFIYAPLMYFLRSPPNKEEKEVILYCMFKKIYYFAEIIVNFEFYQIVVVNNWWKIVCAICHLPERRRGPIK